MEKCVKCGHVHCCHEETESEIITTTGEDGSPPGFKFKRTKCKICGKWLGDDSIN